MFGPEYVSIDKQHDKNQRSWRPLLYVLTIFALGCAVVLFTVTNTNRRHIVLVNDEESAAENQRDFQTSFNGDLKKGYALPRQVDKEYEKVNDEVSFLEEHMDDLKRKSKHGQIVDISFGNQGPPGPKGPRGKAGSKGPQGPAPSGPPTIKKCAVGLFFNGASCSPCTTGPCPISMYRQACSATEDSRCATCSNGPAHSFYVAGGTNCEWSCERDFFRDGQSCRHCSRGPCPIGKYRAACTKDSDSQCLSCTNKPANSVFTSAGQPKDPNSCQVACAEGYWNNGKSCMACDTAPCAVGQYRSKCLANSNSQCVICTVKPANSHFTTNAVGGDSCGWACDNSFFRNGGTCSSCSTAPCSVGQYRTICTATADSICTPCTNIPANAVYTSNGNSGDPKSCSFSCITGYWKNGYSCSACDTTSCGVGMYRSACTATANGQCVPCSTKPASSSYVSTGKPYNVNACDWNCDTGFFRNVQICTVCSSLTCPIGQYSTVCTITADSACRSCTNLPNNGVYSSAGQKGDPNSCQTSCKPGYFKVGSFCLACDTTSCAVGQYRSACTASANGQCVSCTKAPSNSKYISAGKPYGADACDWTCNTGYFVNGAICSACSTSVCPNGQYRTPCTANADSQCKPCVNLPSNGVFISPGNLGDAGSCQTSCLAGYFKVGASCVACDTTSCSVGYYRSACTAAANGQCVRCTKAPANAQYTSAGKPYGADACDWTCLSGYFLSGGVCAACSTSACPVGQYRTICGANTDSTCAACTNLPTNGIYTSAGQQGDSRSCKVGCSTGYFMQGSICVPCDTSSCPTGQYRSACTATANGQCVPCTKGPVHSSYKSGGKPYNYDACDWSCLAGYFADGSTCSQCSSSTCPVGKYRTPCTATVDSVCQACTNLPTNGVFASAGNVGDPASCQTTCVSGYFKVGATCVACDTTSCSVGEYRSACSASANGQCRPCTKAPANAQYTSPGKPYGSDACDWKCNNNFYQYGSSCARCTTGTCSNGQYRTTCGPDKDSVCSPCTNLPANGVFTSAGNQGDPTSCQTSCISGFFKVGTTCVACDTSSCQIGQYRSACTAAANGQCVACTKAPSNAKYTSAGKPYGSNACDWTCNTGYYLSGESCLPCSTSACPVGQYRTQCTSTANSQCLECNNRPANGIFTTPGQLGDPASCQTSCASGFYKEGAVCKACDTSSCAVGQYRSACTASANGQCVSCTKVPEYASYTSAGKPYNVDACDWACQTGHYRSGSVCSPCTSVTCQVGQYSTVCTPTANSACQTCTNLPSHSVFTSAGKEGNPNSCESACAPGYWKDGSSCAACDTSSCPVGNYRSPCTASANGKCVACSKAPEHAVYTSGGKPYNSDDCDWSCASGYYLSGSTCLPCSNPTCPIGQYSTICTPTANSVCQACTDLPSHGTFTSSGEKGSAGSCQTACVAGYWKQASSCIACTTTSCSVGNYRSACTASADGQCVPCTNKPAGASYTSAGQPYNSDDCAWSCTTGNYLSGSTCSPCSTLTCPVGQYSTICTPTANSVCQACTNLPTNGIYTSAGTAGQPNSCQTGCASGYYGDGSGCSACKNLVFTLVPGGNNYATCDGVYVLDTRTINGKPLYVNSPGSRFLAWNTGAWVITGTQWLDGIVASQGYFGAFQTNNGNADPMQGWANYAVTYPQTTNSLAACGASWTCAAGFYIQVASCTSCQNLLFTVKPNGDNYATCDGEYVLDPRTVNGKPIYINTANSRFLAYSSTGGWVLTATQYLAGILASGGSFGGFHGNGNADPKVGWANYVVNFPQAPAALAACTSSWTCPSGYYLDTTTCSSCQNLVFVTKPSGNNYADCSGVYAVDSRTVNGKPVYINSAKSRFLAYSRSGGWVITGTQYLDGIVSSGGSFGGFHGNSGADPTAAWANYNVQKPNGC